MKVTTSITLDLDLAQLLDKERNKTLLISGLLRNYFKEQLQPEIKPASELEDDLEVEELTKITE